jgi:phosphonate transport system ATP-binding protein
MRLLRELAAERHTPALVNIHDVGLAQAFADRIVGLRDGQVVFDDQPAALDAATLTAIYGEEDWSATIRAADDDEPSSPAAATPPRTRA